MSGSETDTLLVINSLNKHILAAIAAFGLFAGTFMLTGCLQPRTVKTAPQAHQTDQLLAAAATLEKQGHYLEARKQCEHALEIDPRDSRALACKARLDQTLRRHADEKVRNGIAMAKKGKPDAANRLFLEALQLWPMHEQALRQIARHHPLTQTPFILHTLEPGDNLTTIALKYYGNSLYYPMISEFNQIQHDSRVRAGERLRIPKINGLPLNTHGAALKTMTPADRKVAAYRAQGMTFIRAGKFKQAIAPLEKALRIDHHDLATRQQLAAAYHGLGQQLFEKKEYDKARDHFLKGLKIDPNCMPCQEGSARYDRTIADRHIAEGRRLLEADRYDLAIAELEKARELNVDEREIDDLISEAYYQKAKGLCAIEDLHAAQKHFEIAAKINPKSFSKSDYERQCRDAYLEIHYNLGINSFQKGQVHTAIAEWEKVNTLNPDYKAVRYNLGLARMLLEPAD